MGDGPDPAACGGEGGVNTATDPDNTTTGNAIPSTYQPLLNAYPAPGGNTDGGSIGVAVASAGLLARRRRRARRR